MNCKCEIRWMRSLNEVEIHPKRVKKVNILLDEVQFAYFGIPIWFPHEWRHNGGLMAWVDNGLCMEGYA